MQDSNIVKWGKMAGFLPFFYSKPDMKVAVFIIFVRNLFREREN